MNVVCTFNCFFFVNFAFNKAIEIYDRLFFCELCLY